MNVASTGHKRQDTELTSSRGPVLQKELRFTLVSLSKEKKLVLLVYFIQVQNLRVNPECSTRFTLLKRFHYKYSRQFHSKSRDTLIIICNVQNQCLFLQINNKYILCRFQFRVEFYYFFNEIARNSIVIN